MHTMEATIIHGSTTIGTIHGSTTIGTIHGSTTIGTITGTRAVKILKWNKNSISQCFYSFLNSELLLITTNNQSKHPTPEVLKLGFGQNISESKTALVE
jgi:hypothetical protein